MEYEELLYEFKQLALVNGPETITGRIARGAVSGIKKDYKLRDTPLGDLDLELWGDILMATRDMYCLFDLNKKNGEKRG